MGGFTTFFRRSVMAVWLFCFLILELVFEVKAGRLAVVKGDTRHHQPNYFVKDGQRVFLSGVNLAWITYGHDFGNNHFQRSKPKIEQYMKELHEAGGNSMRFWLFMQGENVPEFTGDGHVRGLDAGHTFITDFQEMVKLAQQYNILLFPCLWNGAVAGSSLHKLEGLIRDEMKLTSFIDNALIPLVQAVKGDPAIGGWDLMNEPEGLLNINRHDHDPCFDLLPYFGDSGWAAKLFSYKELLKFINWMAAGIKSVDPEALITVGVNKVKLNTDNFNRRNHYKDECLIRAGGKPLGVLSFYSVHSYSWHDNWESLSPFKHTMGEYGLDKPLVVAEFTTKRGAGMTATQMYKYLYGHGYSGAWTWAATDGYAGTPWEEEKLGVAAIRNATDPTKGLVAFSV